MASPLSAGVSGPPGEPLTAAGGTALATSGLQDALRGAAVATPAGPVAAQTTNGTPIYFTRDPAGNLVSMRIGAGAGSTNSYYLTDALGSVLSLTDATGAETASYSYDPYGKPLTATGTQATVNPWRFAGGYLDASGLTKFGTRYYDPAVGRWTQRDSVVGSIAAPTSVDRYVYVGGEPVGLADPTSYLFGISLDDVIGGLECAGAVVGIGAAVAGVGADAIGLASAAEITARTVAGVAAKTTISAGATEVLSGVVDSVC